VNGSESIAVRGSICPSVFMLGAGPEGGIKLPWAKTAGAISRRAQAFLNLAIIGRLL
jgi:hypothetical protein